MHNHTSFFKYTSAATAETILRTTRLRWSSPLLFNDPFDVVRKMADGVVPSKVQECLIQMIIALLRSSQPIPDGLDPMLRTFLERARASGDSVAKEYAVETLRSTPLAQHSKGFEELRAVWDGLVPCFRILCLSEANDNAAMWTHYADDWKGVVLEFRCLAEQESPWFLAKPVVYSAEEPLVTTPEGWARLILMGQPAWVSRIEHEAVYMKKYEWSYEKEWRILDMKRESESGLFTDSLFHRDELAAVYVGPRIAEEDRTKIMRLRNLLYPDASIYAATIGIGRQIKFEQYT